MKQKRIQSKNLSKYRVQVYLAPEALRMVDRIKLQTGINRSALITEAINLLAISRIENKNSDNLINPEKNNK